MATWRQPWLTLGCTKNKLQNSTCELFTLLTLHISPYLFIEVQTHSFNKHMLIYNTDVCLFNVCIHSLNKSLLNLLGARHGIIFTRVFSYAWYLSVSRYTVHPQEKTPCILPIVVGGAITEGLSFLLHLFLHWWIKGDCEVPVLSLANHSDTNRTRYTEK